jgi:uncharacterized membrane protein
MTRTLKEIFEEIKQRKTETVIHPHVTKEEKVVAEKPTIKHVRKRRDVSGWLIFAGFLATMFVILLIILGIENLGHYYNGLYDSKEYFEWISRSSRSKL